jgi:hypothetical protein
VNGHIPGPMFLLESWAVPTAMLFGLAGVCILLFNPEDRHRVARWLALALINTAVAVMTAWDWVKHRKNPNGRGFSFLGIRNEDRDLFLTWWIVIQGDLARAVKHTDPEYTDGEEK